MGPTAVKRLLTEGKTIPTIPRIRTVNRYTYQPGHCTTSGSSTPSSIKNRLWERYAHIDRRVFNFSKEMGTVATRVETSTARIENKISKIETKLSGIVWLLGMSLAGVIASVGAVTSGGWYVAQAVIRAYEPEIARAGRVALRSFRGDGKE